MKVTLQICEQKRVFRKTNGVANDNIWSTVLLVYTIRMVLQLILTFDQCSYWYVIIN